MRRTEERAFKFGMDKLESFLDAADGKPSRCAVFSPLPGSQHGGFTESQQDAIRLYVETWIAEPLRAVYAATVINSRDWKNEEILKSFGKDG